VFVNERHFRPRSLWIIGTMLHCVRHVSLDISCVQNVFVTGLFLLVGLPVHRYWSNKAYLLSALVTFSAVSDMFQSSALVPLSVFLVSRFLVKHPVLSFCRLSSKIPSASPELLNGMLHYRYSLLCQNYYLQWYRLLLFNKKSELMLMRRATASV